MKKINLINFNLILPGADNSGLRIEHDARQRQPGQLQHRRRNLKKLN